MAETAVETAYYLSSKPPMLALVGKGVRFPGGQWMRVAGWARRPWLVQELVPQMFPSLRGKPLPFHVLLTDFDVMEFERELLKAL